MSGHGGQGTDDAFGAGTWLPGGYATGSAEDDQRGGSQLAGSGSDGRHRVRGSTRTSQDGDGQTGPPWQDADPSWERPGWGDTGDMAGQHPSGPLPSQPLADDDWPEFPPAFGYPGDEPGYPSETGQAGGYADDTGSRPTGQQQWLNAGGEFAAWCGGGPAGDAA